MAAPGRARLWRPGRLCAFSAGIIDRRTLHAGPMLTLVESSAGQLCPYHAPESVIAPHPFRGLPETVPKCSARSDLTSMPGTRACSPTANMPGQDLAFVRQKYVDIIVKWA